jgi:hypothetical protein
MRKQIVTQDELDEAKSAFASSLEELHSGRATNTGKGFPFDHTLNELLAAAFIYEASNEQAKVVPLYRRDLSEFLEQGRDQLEDYKWRFMPSDLESRRIGPDLYAVSLSVGSSLDLDGMCYKKESRILHAAYDASKTAVKEVINEVLGLHDRSELGSKVERILDKKIKKGLDFLSEYLNIIAPESETPLSGFPTFQQLVEERIKSPTSTTPVTDQESPPSSGGGSSEAVLLARFGEREY